MSDYPRVEVDEVDGAVYIYLSGKTVNETVELFPGRVMVDYDLDGKTVGVEVLL